MIIGECPYGCGNVHMIPMHPEALPGQILKVPCENCRKDMWVRLSRIDPDAWTSDEFFSMYRIDEEKKTIFKIEKEE